MSHTFVPEESETLIQVHYYTRRELARQLDTTVRHLDRLRAQGRGPPAVLIAGKLYFRKSALEPWLHSLEKPGHFAGRRSKAKQAEEA